MYNKKTCDGERSVVVTYLTQAMFFFNGKRVKENRKVYERSKFWFSWIVYFFFVYQIKLIWKHIYYDVNTYI